MIELRYVVPEGTSVPPPIARLQYRLCLTANVPSGFVMPASQWGPWMDVPIAVLPSPTGAKDNG